MFDPFWRLFFEEELCMCTVCFTDTAALSCSLQLKFLVWTVNFVTATF